MRKTLHEYTIEKWKLLLTAEYNDAYELMTEYYKYATLTNRQPKLGDFVPTDDGGNVLEKPDYYEKEHYNDLHINEQKKWLEYQKALERVIFKGDWEVVDLIGGYIELENKKFNCKVRFDSYGDIFVISDNTYPSVCNRIEDLPLEIEFKEGVI